MRAVEINLFPTPATLADSEQFEEELEYFLSSLRHNSNLCADWIVLELEGKWQVRSMSPADDALEPAHWDIYAHKSHEILTTLSHSPPELHIVPELVPDTMCCNCPNSSSLVLDANRTSLYPLPVDCLDCGRSIPLYRLPYVNGEEEHWTLRLWHRNGQTLDQLFMNTHWGERMAYSQLSNPRAGFITYSREVAASLEKATGKPVYVFLLNIYEARDAKCLRCGRPWLWPDSPKERYAFKCDHCRLVSQSPTVGHDTDPNCLSKMHP